ncbi:AAA family ATPase [Micromonospora ureilytica]|uniref:KGGVGR-motif variant AAA ATPase n=1 Tax=Micromonospora ureilytica TaxID=709868 RepID=UPI0033D67BD8
MNEQAETPLPAHPDHLFTWLDVNQYFADLAQQAGWPPWLREVDAYWDSARVLVDPAVPTDEVWNWLRQVLGPLTIDPERSVLLLDDAGDERPLAVEIERTNQLAPPDRRPRWNDRRVVAELSQSLPPPKPALPHDVPIVAFHSFKGGVGRTLHCVAAARRIADSGRRVLLVDADLEAPGVTWMVADSTRIDFSYEDFLALVHGATDETYTEAISIGRKFLANQELDGIVVMPSRRHHLRVAPPRIEPVDLLTTDRDPYVLTEALNELGHAVGADVVLVDLRAGSSELSAPLLLDPRVLRVFVTTISDQSVRGTTQLITELARRAPARQQTDPDCGLVITQFNPQDHDGRVASVATELRNAAMLVSRNISLERNQVDADVAIPVISSQFESGLLNLPASWDDVVRLATRSGLTNLMGELVDPLLAEDQMLHPAAQPDDLTADVVRDNLAKVADALVYAEQAGEHDFLPTDALRNLAQAHRTELPVEVVIGSKGAGKTFTYLQLCTRPTWAAFTEAAGVPGSTLAVPTVAVLASTTLKSHVEETITARRTATADRLTGREPASFLKIRETIREALGREMSPARWRRLWLACFGQALGLDATEDNAEEALTTFAGKNSVVFVLDGLEDLFQNFVDDRREQHALRALLVDCPDWLRTLRGRPLGLVAFVRRDLIREAINQNVAQFERRYEKYALRWNQDEALRLTVWVCQRGGIFGNTELQVRAAGREELSAHMLAVWGEKMGTAKSREARSEVWFFAALSDFNQQIQARDIVSFIATAAESSIGSDERWDDRVLTPLAMRNALPLCSQKKIEAISEENRPVGRLLARLRSLDASQRSLPFKLDVVGLNSQEAELLEANGVMLAEDGQYWIPEIFRHGLNFTMRSGRRPRVLAVAHLVRRRNDLAS